LQKFKTWIKQYQGIYSRFSILANDIAQDECFPKSNSYNTLHSYFEDYATWSTLGMFEIAWKYYKGQVDTSIEHYRLGMRLEFVRLLLMSIQNTPEINVLLHGEESSCLGNMIRDLGCLKSNMEEVMYHDSHEWANTEVYYGNSGILDDLREKVISELDARARDKAKRTMMTKGSGQMKTREEIFDRIAKLEKAVDDAEAEIKRKRSSTEFQVDIQDLERYITGNYQRICTLQWVLGMREE